MNVLSVVVGKMDSKLPALSVDKDDPMKVTPAPATNVIVPVLSCCRNVGLVIVLAATVNVKFDAVAFAIGSWPESDGTVALLADKTVTKFP